MFGCPGSKMCALVKISPQKDADSVKFLFSLFYCRTEFKNIARNYIEIVTNMYIEF